jgi:hypothetical protein
MLGETLVTWGGGTVKFTLLVLATPLTVTFTMPEMAAAGTVAVIWVSLQAVGVTFVEPN